MNNIRDLTTRLLVVAMVAALIGGLVATPYADAATTRSLKPRARPSSRALPAVQVAAKISPAVLKEIRAAKITPADTTAASKFELQPQQLLLFRKMKKGLTLQKLDTFYQGTPTKDPKYRTKSGAVFELMPLTAFKDFKAPAKKPVKGNGSATQSQSLIAR